MAFYGDSPVLSLKYGGCCSDECQHALDAKATSPTAPVKVVSDSDLLPLSGAKRQADYSARQRAQGRKQRSFWLSDDEAKKVAELLERLRSELESRQKAPEPGFVKK